MLESELFGHEKGAFTGADRRRIGKFEQLNGGTLFLDEIGDMSPVMQSKLLRLLQEQQFERVGGNETVCADVRVIAATHRSLEAMMDDGGFRADLFYRLNVCAIELPPLRDRKGDLAVLVKHFLQQISRDFDKELLQLDESAMERLRSYAWPGNVRELQSVLKRAVLSECGPILRSESLLELTSGAGQIADINAAVPMLSRVDAALSELIQARIESKTANFRREILDRVDRLVAKVTLKNTGGNLSEAARLLGISRPTLRSKLGRERPDSP